MVVASGYFNPLHYGHVSYLQKARDLGTSLLVIVYNDEQAALKMGSDIFCDDHPSIPARDRVRLVRSLACVDLAIESIDKDDSVAETVRLLHPNVFANCGNKHATAKEVAVCHELGVKLVDGLGIEMLLLEGFTQHYEWGKPRRESAVAALSGKANHQSPKDCSKKGKPFAELWMGDHPSGPSTVMTPNGTASGCLISTFKTAPNVLGSIVSKEGSLPFLMKVLSIEKALSIQAHPDRGLAAKLHKERPEVYKDPNHKPEIAIALAPDFTALCGFRPVPELLEMVDSVPELLAIIGENAAQRLRYAAKAGCTIEEQAALKKAFTKMIRSSGEEANALIKALAERAVAVPPPGGHSEHLTKVYGVVIRLYQQFPDDIGIFCPFFMNYVQMDVGECLYMPQNTPHAYLSGDIVECMACSDNVVRAALSPKLKDLDVLCEMLDYRGGQPWSVKAQHIDDDMQLYKELDIEEFQVTHLRLETGRRRRICFSWQGPALGFAWRGNGTLKISGETTSLAPGVVFFLSVGVDAEFYAELDLDCFVACCPSHYFKRQSGVKV